MPQPAAAYPNPSGDRHASIVSALGALGYRPASSIGNAASRLARAPQLVEVLFIYIKAGKPLVNYDTQVPKNLFTPLPGGHSVATLMRDFGLDASGAFLMASELVADSPAALDLLVTITEEGYYKQSANGVREFIRPPISATYPSCPNCGRRWVRSYPSCPGCGYGEMERQLDNNEIPDQILAEFLNALRNTPASPQTPPGTAAGQQVCPSCGAANTAGKTFCTKCGAHIEPPTVPTRKFCGSCGTSIPKEKNFCPQCGAKL